MLCRSARPGEERRRTEEEEEKEEEKEREEEENRGVNPHRFAILESLASLFRLLYVVNSYASRLLQNLEIRVIMASRAFVCIGHHFFCAIRVLPYTMIVYGPMIWSREVRNPTGLSSFLREAVSPWGPGSGASGKSERKMEFYGGYS